MANVFKTNKELQRELERQYKEEMGDDMPMHHFVRRDKVYCPWCKHFIQGCTIAREKENNAPCAVAYRRMIKQAPAVINPLDWYPFNDSNHKLPQSTMAYIETLKWTETFLRNAVSKKFVDEDIKGKKQD